MDRTLEDEKGLNQVPPRRIKGLGKLCRLLGARMVQFGSRQSACCN